LRSGGEERDQQQTDRNQTQGATRTKPGLHAGTLTANQRRYKLGGG
jgi:hypothetical protein